METVNGSGFISDESSFYGSSSRRTSLESLVNSSSTPLDVWSNDSFLFPYPSTVRASLNEQDHCSPKQEEKEQKQEHEKDLEKELYNAYADVPSARQLDESIPEFLKRLPPSASTTQDCGPWIWICNPYTSHRPTSEDWRSFTAKGETLLSELTQQNDNVKNTIESKSKAVITRAINRNIKNTTECLTSAAQHCKCTTGKWMLFPGLRKVDGVWRIVARATAENELGISAKVATKNEADPQNRGRLVCVYTKDFSDTEDVKRVLKRMVELELLPRNGKSIYYKCEAFTHLGITSGNEWNIKSSLYASKDLLKG